QLHQSQSAVHRAARLLEKIIFADVLGHGDSINRWQLERAKHRRVRRQQGFDVESARRLPCDRLAIAAMRLAIPGKHAKEIELDVRMGIHESLCEPRRDASYLDAELFGEFANQRVARGFAFLELAARKLPITGIRSAGQALSQQDFAVASHKDRRGDADEPALAHFFFLPAFNARAPACERANCQAMRPLREPRWSAN